MKFYTIKGETERDTPSDILQLYKKRGWLREM